MLEQVRNCLFSNRRRLKMTEQNSSTRALRVRVSNKREKNEMKSKEAKKVVLNM
ncbi:unnamed protein product [Larinioides sclopetarius]|uniref:Uncharacterized protein n=1 Tax=Larinioides sclopetarius TaxID=280406 RepID=A0AAV2B9A6_9ARAC